MTHSPSDRNEATDALLEVFWQGRRAMLDGRTQRSLSLFRQVRHIAQQAQFEDGDLLGEVAYQGAIRNFGVAYNLLSPKCDARAIADSSIQGHLHFLLGSLCFDRREYVEAAWHLHIADSFPDTARWQSYVKLFAANIELLRNNNESAIMYCQHALRDPRFDWRDEAWKIIGFSSYRLGNIDNAYSAFLTAIPYCKCGKEEVFYHLGIIALSEKKWDQAREWLERAVAEPENQYNGDTLFCLGYAYQNQSQFTDAIRFYTQALDHKSTLTEGASRLFNLGTSYMHLNETHSAIDCWERAKIDLMDQGDDEETIAMLTAVIDAAKRPSSVRTPTEKALVTLPAQWGDWQFTAIQPIFVKIHTSQTTLYYQYTQQRITETKDILAILKGWGSAVPLVMGEYTGCRGGGYFLKWNGKGIVIDPGHDFLLNYRECGYHASEFQAVVVTHNHSDHVHDLRALDDLRYELMQAELKYADTVAFPGTPSDIEINNIVERWKYILIWDRDSWNSVKLSSGDADYPHRIEKRFPYGITVERHITRSIDLRPFLPFRLICFSAKHSVDVRNALGLRIECYDGAARRPTFTLGYTSDTGYIDILSRPDVLGNCDVLISHISQPKPDELIKKSSPPKSGHLRYRGVQRVVSECQPAMTIVSEFWAGIADLRLELVHALKEECGTTHILPGSIGLCIDPREKAVICTHCNRSVPYEELIAAAPTHRYGPISYLCNRCRLNLSD